MGAAHKKLYGTGRQFCSFALDDLPATGDEPLTVNARVLNRGEPFYKEGVYEVVAQQSYEPILSGDTAQAMTQGALVEQMPPQPRKRGAVVSLRGEYLTVREQHPDGRTGPSRVIPVELVYNVPQTL